MTLDIPGQITHKKAFAGRMCARRGFNRKPKTMKKLLAVVALATLVNLTASAQTYFDLFTTTNGASITTNAATHVGRVTLQKGKPLTVTPTFKLDGESVEDVVLGFNVSLDGTLWTTTCPATATVAANGTNTVVGFATLSTNVTDNARFIRFDRIVGPTNGLNTLKILYRFQQ